MKIRTRYFSTVTVFPDSSLIYRYLRPADETNDIGLYEVELEDPDGCRHPLGEYDDSEVHRVMDAIRSAYRNGHQSFRMPAGREYPLSGEIIDMGEAWKRMLEDPGPAPADKLPPSTPLKM